MIQKNKANVIIDGQWGSTGKGLLSAYLYDRYPALIAGVCDFMPNAGHTVIMRDGAKFVSRHIPVAAAFGRFAYIGPHSAIDPVVFEKELYHLRGVIDQVGEIVVHPLAVMVGDQDQKTEQLVMGRIASTAKGGHAAFARKSMRAVDSDLAGQHRGWFEKLNVRVADTQELVQKTLARGGTVLCETAQGFDLGLNHGMSYPHVTGRDCLVGRALDNAGVPIRDCGSIGGCLRTFPIRVGSTELGYSGPFYPDQKELSWKEVSVFAGREVEETTTVTGRVRRVFTFSDVQLRRFLTFVRPDWLFLNFWNYLDKLNEHQRREKFWHLKAIATEHGAQLRLIGRGPLIGDVSDVEHGNDLENVLKG